MKELSRECAINPGEEILDRGRRGRDFLFLRCLVDIGADGVLAPLPAIILGIVTGCVGGIIRDVIAGEPSILMRPELYVTAAAFGSTLYVIGEMLGLPDGPTGVAAALACFALRGAAMVWHIELPAYSRERKET